ncbi:MAG: SRPBCC domain-containing protein [Flavobacteriales bacterium]|nr:SRPBCC domain-containing protein [Flavobacteriales bacterium]
MAKEKFEREYIIKSSAKIIYNCISTPSGLSEWFSDDVNIRGDVYTFVWDNAEEQARMIGKKRDEYIKFRWLEDEEEDEKAYFELRIKIDPLTKEVAIIVTDYAEEDEIEDQELLWDSQIDELKHILGS